MAKRRYTAEEIVTVLRQVEVAMANGKTTPHACRESGITEQTYYRWRKEYGGLKLRAGQATQGTRAGELAAQATGGGAVAGEADPAGRDAGKLISPERRRLAVAGVRQQYRFSERHARRLLFQWRGTQRYTPTARNDEDGLTRAIISLASEYGRYGYRRVAVELRKAGWAVGKDRVERIWRREGLKVPRRQLKRGRLWLNDGSCVRLRPERANHLSARQRTTAGA
jgi:putative transposase